MSPDGGESDDEWETDEESYVVVEVSGFINNDWIDTCEERCKILGLETDRPVLQVDRYVFFGEYEDAAGTSVLFEQKYSEDDSEDDPLVQLKYRFHTHHKLCMKRGFLSEKQDADKPQLPEGGNDTVDYTENLEESKKLDTRNDSGVKASKIPRDDHPQPETDS